MKRNIFLFAFIGLLQLLPLANDALGQGVDAVCRRKLDRARDEFRKGNLYAIKELLVHCLNLGFDKQEKIEAYRLLTITSLYIKQDSEAEVYLVELLKLDPFFTAKSGIDPDQLVYLYRKFNTDPFLYIGFSASFNRPNYKQLNEVNLSGVSIDNSPEVSPLFGLSLGVNATLPTAGPGSFGMNLSYHSIRFGVTRNIYSQGVSPEPTQTVSYTESANYLQSDIFMEIDFSKNKKVLPYLSAGAGGSLLLNANILTPTRRRNPPGQVISGQDIDIKNKRKSFNPYFNISAGFKFNFPKYSVKLFGAFTQYIFPITNYSSESARYDPELIADFGIIENDYRMSFFNVGVLFQRSYYNFTKKKKYQ